MKNETLLLSDTFAKLKGLVNAASTEATRYYLNGVYIDGSNGVAVATNGHIMAEFKHDAFKDMPSVIIPSELFKKFKPHKNSKVMLIVNAGVVTFQEVGGTSMTLKAIDGTYPDYARVKPPIDVTTQQTFGIGLPNMISMSGLAKAAGTVLIRFDEVHPDKPGRVTIGDYAVTLMPMKV